MKSIRLPVFVTTLLLTFTLLLAARPNAVASAEEQSNEAVAASNNWVKQIDAGKYEDSYSFTCGSMRDITPQDRWIAVLKALRTPWGNVVTRRTLSHIYKPNGLKGLNGECMVITYDTNFKNLSQAQEEVVLKWEDGKWRGAGYTAGPKLPEDGSSRTPAVQTEVQTQSHVKAEPKTP